MYKYIFILQLFFTNVASAELLCETKSLRTFLVYNDPITKVRYEVLDMEFLSVPYVQESIPCTFWLANINRFISPEMLEHFNDIKQLVSHKSLKSVRLVGETKRFFYRMCNMHPACKIRFPYNLLTPRYYQHLFKKNANISNLPTCNISKNYKRKISHVYSFDDLLELDNVDKEDNKIDIDFYQMPYKTISDRTIELIKQLKPKKVLISAMSYSNNQIERLIDVLKSIPKNKRTSVDFVYSMPIHMLNYNFAQNLEQYSEYIDFHPIQNTPDYFDSYHIKGVLLEGGTKDAFIFTTTNYRTYEKSRIKDIGFSIYNQKKLNKYFKNIVNRAISHSCETMNYFKCNLSLRLLEKEFLYTSLIKYKTKICHKYNSKFSLNKGRAVQELITELIISSRKEILLMSHIIDQSEVLDLLTKKNGESISTKVIYGSKIDYRFKKSKLPSFVLGANKENLEPHGKFLIVDKKVLFFGTGNFTKTGLKNPNEIFFTTTNETILKEFRKFFISEFKKINAD